MSIMHIYIFLTVFAHANIYDDFNENYETLFVFEMIRHGARSHYLKTPNLPNPDTYWGPGV